MCPAGIGRMLGPFPGTMAAPPTTGGATTPARGAVSMNRHHVALPDRARGGALTRRSVLRTVGGGLVAAAALGGLGLASPTRAAGAATQRPISDFLGAQGTTN